MSKVIIPDIICIYMYQIQQDFECVWCVCVSVGVSVAVCVTEVGSSGGGITVVTRDLRTCYNYFAELKRGRNRGTAAEADVVGE